MDGDGHIKTQFDDLLENLKDAAGKPVSVRSLASSCKMPYSSVLQWLNVLEKEHKVILTNRLSGVYASWAEPLTGREQPYAIDAVYVGSEDEADFDAAREAEREAALKRVKKQVLPGQAGIWQTPEAEAAQETDSDDGSKQKRKQILDLTREVGQKLEEKQISPAKSNAGQKLARVEGLIDNIREKQKEIERKSKVEAELRRLEEDIRNEEQKIEFSERTEAVQAPSEEIEGADSTDETAEIAPEQQSEETTSTSSPRKKIIPTVEKIERRHGIAPGKDLTSALEISLPAEKEEITIESYITPAFKKARKKIEKIKKPVPVQITGVSLQFSEKLSRQMKRIASQVAQINALRAEKARFLTEQYMPMERKLESELETVTDRVSRVEKGIVNLQQRASELPSQAAEIEKLQVSSVKAHAEMRKAYDEAVALMEESTRELADERGKMEEMTEQSRHEIAQHRAKAEELSKTLNQLSHLELEAQDRVIAARAALADQAERLSVAENHSQELSNLKDEITDNVLSIKREITTAKTTLTNIEKQMEQMRQIEIWADSIRDEYGKRMEEISDYVKYGNEEFETLRESVEANFVRKYLRDLRQIADSYTFELGQAKSSEADLETLIEVEKKKLDSLIESARRVSYEYESQAKLPEGAEKFEAHRETFDALENVSEKRVQVEQMIAQIVGNKTEHQPKLVGSTQVKQKKAKKQAKARKPAARKPKPAKAMKQKAKVPAKSQAQKITKAKAQAAKAKAPTKSQAQNKAKAHKKGKKR